MMKTAENEKKSISSNILYQLTSTFMFVYSHCSLLTTNCFFFQHSALCHREATSCPLHTHKTVLVYRIYGR